MGFMRFLVPGRELLPDEALERIFMTGLEEIPWKSRVFWNNDQLVLERGVSDSGNVHVPWKLQDRGEMIFSTASLMERERPYLLPVELARGTINVIRNQIALWQTAGLIVPAEIGRRIGDAVALFAKAATSQHEPMTAARHAAAAIEDAVQIIDEIGRSYTTQALRVRRRQNPRLGTLLGVNLGGQPPSDQITPDVAGTFNSAVVPLDWRRIEAHEGKRAWTQSDAQFAWCQKHGLKTISGPLLLLDGAGTPDWAYLWDGDFTNLLSFMSDHVKAVVSRYRGKVQLWQVCGRVNIGAALSLTEEQRLQVTVRAIETLRAIDPRTPVVVSFDQPWAEYLAKRDLDLTAMHFADALVRAELGLAGLALEVNAGYFPGGSMPYSQLAYSRQLDRWSMLGLPLMVVMTAPSGSTPDGMAASPAQVLAGSGRLSPRTQRQWVEDYVTLMLAKNCVQVLVWNQLRDAEPHLFPHGGLFDAEDQPKPALGALGEIRKEYLG